MRRRKPTKVKANLATRTKPATTTATAASAAADSAQEMLYAARLQKRLGISDVTLWRWRHDERLGFPKGRLINRRVYFPWHEVAAWLERQQQVA